MEVTRIAQPRVAAPGRSATRIEPPSGWTRLDLAELWSYRQVVYFLTWRDVKVRYKQTALGVGWGILQPLLMTAVFTVFFGHVAHVSSGGAPYPLFAFCGLLPWMLFANGVTQGSNSLVGNANMITKVYFPRLALPLSAIAGTALDFLLAALVLGGMFGYYGGDASPAMALAVAFVLLALVAAIGVGTLLAAVNVRYRDVRFIVPFLIQIWLFASPVAYSADSIHGWLRTLYGLNPMAGAITGLRWSLLGGDPPGPMLALSALVALLALGVALVYFQRTEKSFADII